MNLDEESVRKTVEAMTTNELLAQALGWIIEDTVALVDHIDEHTFIVAPRQRGKLLLAEALKARKR